MSWKPAIALTVVFVVLGVFYLAYEPPEIPTVEHPVPAEDWERIRVSRSDGVIEFERDLTSKRERWNVTQPVRWRAQPYRTLALRNSVRFPIVGALKPGQPNWKPELFGLDPPQLTVEAHAKNRSVTIHFGNEMPGEPDMVYVKVEGKEWVYASPRPARATFELPLDDYRDGRVMDFDRTRVTRIVGRKKFIRVTRVAPKTEYQEFEAVRKGEEWVLLRPQEEDLVANEVNGLLGKLLLLTASGFRKRDADAEERLREPQVSYTLTVEGREDPVGIQISDFIDEEMETVLADFGSGKEVALLPKNESGKLSGDPHALRSHNPYTFGTLRVESITIASRGRRLVMVHEEGEGEDAPGGWKVTEPADVPVYEPALATFIQSISRIQILEYLPAQEDLSAFGLDPPTVVMSFRLEEKEEAVYLLGVVGDAEHGTMKRDGRDELFKISGHVVRGLGQLHLNVRKLDMFEVPRERILGFSFSWQERGAADTFSMDVRKNAKGIWEYHDVRHIEDKMKPHRGRVEALLSRLSRIIAEQFVGQGDQTKEKYGLDGVNPVGRLTIEYREGEKLREKTLFISEDLGSARRPILYAAFEDSPITFRIDPDFVKTLHQDVRERPRPLRKR